MIEDDLLKIIDCSSSVENEDEELSHTQDFAQFQKNEINNDL